MSASLPLRDAAPERTVTTGGASSATGEIAQGFNNWLSRAFENQSLARRCIAAIPFAALILFMEYSTAKWKLSQPRSAGDWAGIFHSEMLILVFIFFVPFLFGVFRRHYVAVLSLFYAICVLDFIAWFAVDRPFRPADLFRGAEMVEEYSEFVGQLGRVLLVKISIFILAPIVIWLVDKWMTRARVEARLAPLFPQVFFGGMLLYVAAFPFLYEPGYFGHNTFVRIGSEAAYQFALERATPDLAAVRKLFGIPPSTQSSSAAVRTAIGGRKNVIIFVIETAVGRYYPDPVGRFAANGAAPFAGNAFTSAEHYTTYPESDRSIFSILVGQYPPQSKGWIKQPNFDHALPRVLESHGYATYLGSTAPLEFHDDITLMRNVGFRRIMEVGGVKKAFEVKNGEVVWDRSKLYSADLELIDSATRVIREHQLPTASPYLMVLTPQASHAPFQPPPDLSVSRDDDVELIRANAEWQYRLIDRLIAELKATNQFSNTIIIVTGDHGVRSRYETNQLFSNPQLLNEISFHVPFSILNLGRTDLKNPTWATSHIDVTPTMLDLLGIAYAPDWYQGRSMLDPTERTVFFLGGEFVSPNGFKYGDRFYMENRLRHITLVRSSFDFSASASAEPVVAGALSPQTAGQMIATVQSFLMHK